MTLVDVTAECPSVGGNVPTERTSHLHFLKVSRFHMFLHILFGLAGVGTISAGELAPASSYNLGVD